MGFFLAFIFIAYGFGMLGAATVQHIKGRRKVPPEDEGEQEAPMSREGHEAVRALVALGVKKAQAEKLVDFILCINPDLSTEEIVKRAVHLR